MTGPGEWDELAGWFQAMTEAGLRRELEAVRREQARAGSFERKLIDAQYEVLAAEFWRRGLDLDTA